MPGRSPRARIRAVVFDVSCDADCRRYAGIVSTACRAQGARGYVTDDEVLGYLRQHRDLVGIDIDENTVVILRGTVAEVVGDGRATFIDPARSSSAPWLTLRGGQRADVR